MIGLLLKDIFVLRKQLRIAVAILIFYAVLSYTDNNTSMFIYMAVMFGFFLPLTTIGYDDRCEWNKFALTMPIRTKSLVTSKYLLGIIGIAMGALLFLILSFLMNTTIDTKSLEAAKAALYVGIALLSIYLPICFKFGVEKSRFIIIAIFMLPTILLSILAKGNYIKEPSKEQINLIIAIAPILVFCILIVSVTISISIMKRKEY